MFEKKETYCLMCTYNFITHHLEATCAVVYANNYNIQRVT